LFEATVISYCQLQKKNKMYGYFMQDNVESHTTNFSLTTQEEIFDERLITRGLWTPNLHICIRPIAVCGAHYNIELMGTMHIPCRNLKIMFVYRR
jgi:hypothetical protein